MRPEWFFNWTGITLAVINGMITTVIPLNISLGIVSAALFYMLLGYIAMQRRIKREELIAKMDKAFGKPHDRT